MATVKKSVPGDMTSNSKSAKLFNWKTSIFWFFFLVNIFVSFNAFAQPTWTIDLFGKEKKPKQFEEKKLRSEKTGDKKFNFYRRFIQNNITHYNFYFNATNKINGVIEKARSEYKDDYTKMLGFYPYSLDNTASQQIELDSVIYKSTAGILLHDLRTDWVDNMYFLIGKSYYYRKLFDSASMTFQFINYNLFPRKKKEDDNRIVGSGRQDTFRTISIADKEKRNILKKLFSIPPSRNDALIWLAKTFTEQEAYGDAAGLINILQHDPRLPFRLKDDLDQVTSYWFFRQQYYDSAALYLERGLTSAETKSDKSRWQYLIGQMYELNGNLDKASQYYLISGKKTTDPLLDIYSHLNNAKMLRSTNPKELDKSIDALVKMSKKEKYKSYRDIIFHSTAVLYMQKYDTTNAILFFTKSLKNNNNNISYKNKSHLELGKIGYAQKDYMSAADNYDSLDLSDVSIQTDSAEIADKKIVLRKIATQFSLIKNEDSLQTIAALPPAERDLLIKKLVKQYKKKNGIAEEEIYLTDDNKLNSFGAASAQADLFSSSSKGEWYFYNAGSKSKGYGEFKSKWGKRDNVDNWRRKSAMSMALINAGTLDKPASADPLDQATAADSSGSKLVEFSYDALLSSLPLTPEKLDSSNAIIARSILEIAGLFKNELQDYQEAIYYYNIYLQRFTDSVAGGQIYMGLYHCYTKLGNTETASYYKSLLDSKFAESKFAKMLNDPASAQPDKNNTIAERQYAEIFDLFIEGKYDTAFLLKKQADSINGNKYWTPQLLYIESMYYIQCATDSQAIAVLNDIINLYPQSPLKDKALQTIAVLNRRHEIENYLNNLNITREPEAEKIIMPDENVAPVYQPAAVEAIKAPQKIQEIKNIPLQKDTAVKLPSSMISGEFKWQSSVPHSVMMILDKVDVVYINEAKNAFTRYNRDNNFPKVTIVKDALDAEKALLMFNGFINADEAFSYFERIKKAAPREVSWLQPSKYYFFIISESNFNLLKTNKQIDNYKKLLNNQYPGKF